MLHFFLPSAQCLKDKRQFVRKFTERINNRFRVSVAEVGAVEKWQRAIIGISAVGREIKTLQNIFQQIIDMENDFPEVELFDYWFDYSQIEP